LSVFVFWSFMWDEGCNNYNHYDKTLKPIYYAPHEHKNRFNDAEFLWVKNLSPLVYVYWSYSLDLWEAGSSSKRRNFTSVILNSLHWDNKLSGTWNVLVDQKSDKKVVKTKITMQSMPRCMNSNIVYKLWVNEFASYMPMNVKSHTHQNPNYLCPETGPLNWSVS